MSLLPRPEASLTDREASFTDRRGPLLQPV